MPSSVDHPLPLFSAQELRRLETAAALPLADLTRFERSEGARRVPGMWDWLEAYLPAPTLSQQPRSPLISQRTGPAMAAAIQAGHCLPFVPADAALGVMAEAATAIARLDRRRPEDAVAAGEGSASSEPSTSGRPASVSGGRWVRSGGIAAAVAAASEPSGTEDQRHSANEGSSPKGPVTAFLLPPALFPGPADYAHTVESGEGAASLLRPVALQLLVGPEAEGSPPGTAAWTYAARYAESAQEAMRGACLWDPIPL